jgi:prevent-host-death family protein
MTKHFNVGEAKAQLSKLIDAAVRGEEVVIDRAGVPTVKMVALESAIEGEANQRRARREAFIEQWKHSFDGVDTSVEGLKAHREYSEWRRKAYGMDDSR